MKKKIISAIFLLPFLIFVSTQNVKAQGTFSCQFRAQFGCRVGVNNCDTDYEPDHDVCSSIVQDPEACNQTVNVGCVSSTQEQEEQTQNASAALCENGNGIDTAIGCIPITDTDSFIAFFLGWAIAVGGGIAFLLIVFAGFQIATSSGDPKRLQAGKELMTSAIAGLIMLIFSVFILRVIGIDILGLGGFGFGS